MTIANFASKGNCVRLIFSFVSPHSGIMFPVKFALSTRVVVLNIEMRGRTNHVTVVKIPQKIYRVQNSMPRNNIKNLI